MNPPGSAKAFTDRLSTMRNRHSRSGRAVVRASETPSACT
jgi:hypothetical protein